MITGPERLKEEPSHLQVAPSWAQPSRLAHLFTQKGTATSPVCQLGQLESLGLVGYLCLSSLLEGRWCSFYRAQVHEGKY